MYSGIEALTTKPQINCIMRTIGNSLISLAAALVFIVSTAGIISAQESTPSAKAYIYCHVAFDDFKVHKERQIHNYTQKYTERAYKMYVHCHQYDSELTYISGVINDEEGKPREFRSYIAGLNWLGLMGWELLPYPTTYRSDISQYPKYWFRLDVSGLSTDEINAKLSALKPSNE